MPTYEKRDAEGTVLERTVTLPAGHPSGYDEQMAALAAADGIPWHLVDEHQAAIDPTPAAYSAAVAAASTAVPPFAHDDLKTEEV